jgi:acetylglutamate kinase
VLKLGGELLEQPQDVQRIARGIRTLAAKASLTVVHGGGKEIDAALALAGIPKRQVDGLRVTDGPTLDAVVAVLAGSINTRLVAGRARGRRCAGGAHGRGRGRRGGETCRADREHRGRERGPWPGGHAGGRRRPGAAGGPDGQGVRAGGGVRGSDEEGAAPERERRTRWPRTSPRASRPAGW